MWVCGRVGVWIIWACLMSCYGMMRRLPTPTERLPPAVHERNRSGCVPVSGTVPSFSKGLVIDVAALCARLVCCHGPMTCTSVVCGSVDRHWAVVVAR